MEKNNYNKIKSLCEKINISKGKITDEYLFTLDAVDLFYYNQNIGEIDIKFGFVDGPYDGGIDFIYSTNETMYLIQGKSSSNVSIDEIKNIFTKMTHTISYFDDKNYDRFSNALKESYLNAYDDLNDDKNIELVLFTNTILNEQIKKELESLAQKNPYNNYIINVFGKNEIEIKRAILYQDSDLIKNDSIDLYLENKNTKNILHYGDNGIIINIKATSLKRLYDKYGQNGLFSYNLREHISQKNVDDGIINTIKYERDKFWFYNNGITIGCKDFNIDGYKIKLNDFSIINGAQTTTKIGKSKFINDDKDFAIVCKIVKAPKSFKGSGDFISKISESSNSQKPIKPRDLKSNNPEQKLLQQKSACNTPYTLSIEIKRGVKPKNYKKVEKWQRVTNEFIGQLIYSCILQKPGQSRNSKNTIFSSSKIYKKLFLRKHDYNTLYDLVLLAYYYDEFADNYTSKTNNLNIISIIKNGKLTTLAVLMYLYKKENKILNDSSSENLHKDNINGLLISDYTFDDLEEKLYDAFEFIIRLLNRIYEMKKETMKITSYSNFFKSEQIYDIVLNEIDNLSNYDKKNVDYFMVIFKNKKY